LVSVGQDFGSTATQRRLAARLSPAALSARKGRRCRRSWSRRRRAEDHVRVEADLVELLLGFQADHGLVQQHVVEHRAQGVAGIGVGGRLLDRSEMARPSEPWQFGSAASAARPALVSLLGLANTGAPGLHHRAAERLLLVADLDHEDAHRQAEHLAGVGDRRTPLAGAGFGGQLLGPGQLVVVGLRHGGVRLVRTGRRDAFILEENLGRRAEHLLQAQGAAERRRAPLGVDLADFLGNRNPALGRHFLFQDRVGENGAHRFRRHRVAIRPERRRRRVGHVGDDVVPVGRNIFLF
jgi:hypothetical protein